MHRLFLMELKILLISEEEINVEMENSFQAYQILKIYIVENRFSLIRLKNSNIEKYDGNLKLKNSVSFSSKIPKASH